MNDTASFGYWVRRWRKALDLTQEQLAAQVACAVVTIKKIENDERRPSQQMAERLAVVLNIPEAQRFRFIQVALGERPAYTLYLPEKPIVTARAPSKIPAPLTRLIGRRAEMEAIKDCVRREDVRLVTLSGPGGVGKTRLATQVAQELSSDFKDGVFFVSLAPLNDPDLVPTAIAQTVEARQKPSKSLKETLDAHFADQVALLVLDNFEHLLPASLFISELLESTSSLKILSTSRAPLHLYGERRFIIQPFDLPDASENLSTLEKNDAIALFLERAQVVQSDFHLMKDNASFIAQICSRLDGLPLALELAAARMNVLSPHELLNHLESRLPLLTEGPHDVPIRQQTLTNTIAWSYDLLTQSEKTLFERLSVFRGGGMLEAIKSVCSDIESLTVINALSALVDQSLTQRHEVNGETRLTMLETIREFASERLESKAETDTVRQNHLAYYLQLGQRVEHELMDKDVPLWLDRAEIELDNFRAALGWGLREDASLTIFESAALLAGALWFFWYHRGYWQEGRKWCERALSRAPANSKSRAEALTGIAILLYAQDYHSQAHHFLGEAIEIWRRLNDKWRLANILQIGGAVELARCEYVTARAFYTESLSLYRDLKDDTNEYAIIEAMGCIAYYQGDFSSARIYLEQCLDWFRSQQIRDGLGSVLRWLGDLERTLGFYDQAAADYREALQFSSETGLPRYIANTLHRLGQVALHEEKTSEAQSLFLDSLKLHREMESREGMVECLAGLAGVAVLQKEFERAAKLFGAAEALLESIGVPLAPAERLAWERDERNLRAQLSPHEFIKAWQVGKAMPLENILEEAVRTVKTRANSLRRQETGYRKY